MNFVLKLLNAKQRNEIRKGKLYKVTRVAGLDVWRSRQKPVEAAPLNIVHEECKIEAMQVHQLKNLDDVTNLTKNTDLM